MESHQRDIARRFALFYRLPGGTAGDGESKLHIFMCGGDEFMGVGFDARGEANQNFRAHTCGFG